MHRNYIPQLSISSSVQKKNQDQSFTDSPHPFGSYADGVRVFHGEQGKRQAGAHGLRRGEAASPSSAASLASSAGEAVRALQRASRPPRRPAQALRQGCASSVARRTIFTARLRELRGEPRDLHGGLRKLREPQASTGGCVLTSKQATQALSNQARNRG